MNNKPFEWSLLLTAASFAARCHGDQKRKDGQTPYISHPFRVCLVLQRLFGITDEKILAVALLHDVLEDTAATHAELARLFSTDVADWVVCLSKDQTLSGQEKEERYIEQLKRSPKEVQLIKAADIFDNLQDSAHLSSEKKKAMIQKMLAYLDALTLCDDSIRSLVEKKLREVESLL